MHFDFSAKYLVTFTTWALNAEIGHLLSQRVRRIMQLSIQDTNLDVFYKLCNMFPQPPFRDYMDKLHALIFLPESVNLLVYLTHLFANSIVLM